MPDILWFLLGLALITVAGLVGGLIAGAVHSITTGQPLFPGRVSEHENLRREIDKCWTQIDALEREGRTWKRSTLHQEITTELNKLRFAYDRHPVTKAKVEKAMREEYMKDWDIARKALGQRPVKNIPMQKHSWTFYAFWIFVGVGYWWLLLS